MSRLRYLVSYDISDPKRLRKVARSLEGFGVRLQYSVFECPLDDLRLAKLKAELQDLLNHDEDQVLFVSLGATSKDASLLIEAILRRQTPMFEPLRPSAGDHGAIPEILRRSAWVCFFNSAATATTARFQKS